MKKVMITSVMLMMLVGCATQYKQYDYFTGGFKVEQLSKNLFKVKYISKQSAKVSETIELALLKSGEICRSIQAPYFIVFDMVGKKKLYNRVVYEVDYHHRLECLKSKPNKRHFITEPTIMRLKSKYRDRL